MTRPARPDALPVEVIDTHCHLDVAAAERGEPLGVDEALAEAAAVGVTRVIQVGCDVASSRWSADLAESRPDVWAAVAIHPNDAARLSQREGPRALEEAWAVIEGLSTRPGVRAVGETGLDRYRTRDDEGFRAQEESFRRHIRMARAADRTLVIHDRDAHDDVIRVLEDEGPPDRVVFHCFSGDAAMADYVAARGWFLSFAGVVTFSTSTALREALAVAPLDKVLVETDAPYLTPVPHRGRSNASYLVPITVRAMAEVRGIPEIDMARALWDNAESAFGAL